MENMFRQDFHIHTEASYDATMKMEDLVRWATEQGITDFGITEHVNYALSIPDLQKSRQAFEKNRIPGMHFGVELSPVSIYQHEHSLHTTKEKGPGIGGGLNDFHHPGTPGPDPLVLVLTEDQLRENKVEYVVGAAHNLYHTPIDIHDYASPDNMDADSMIRDYHRQQMFLATDSRVDIVGHPWWVPYWRTFSVLFDANDMLTGDPWFGDFTVIPQSMHNEFAAACKENGKCVEMNISFFLASMHTDSFKQQYAQYIRGLFEQGVPITIGTDRHDDYPDLQECAARYLRPVGFTADDFSLPKFRTYE